MAQDVPVSGFDDPLVQIIRSSWIPHSMTIAKLRGYVDANQRMLMARLAADAVKATSEPYGCHRQAEGGWVCESTLQLEALTKIARILMLNLSWDARQSAKRMMSPEQQAALATALEGEVNW